MVSTDFHDHAMFFTGCGALLIADFIIRCFFCSLLHRMSRQRLIHRPSCSIRTNVISNTATRCLPLLKTNKCRHNNKCSPSRNITNNRNNHTSNIPRSTLPLRNINKWRLLPPFPLAGSILNRFHGRCIHRMLVM